VTAYEDAGQSYQGTVCMLCPILNIIKQNGGHYQSTGMNRVVFVRTRYTDNAIDVETVTWSKFHE
jgi:hypothetical protein